MSKKKKDVYIDDDGCHYEVVNIADTAEEWLNVFAANVNIARITTHFIDGLKPVQRRTLYALYENPSHGMTFWKVSRIQGDTMGKFHPHGDSSIADVTYAMGQPWNQNIPFIDKRGNFGNARGDEPAAPRYTEGKLSKAAQWIFFSDLKYSNVPMRPNFDGTETEPEYLPARIPVILCNPHFSGIGIGVAANIPPFNVSEVMKATIKLIKNPDAKIMLVPDSPSGCDIIDDGQFKTLNEIGDDCTVTMQGTYEIDYVKNIITITSLPLQTTVVQVKKNIVKMRKEGNLDELIDVHDESQKEKIRLKLYLKKTEDPEKFVQKLMKRKIGLKKSFPVEIRIVSECRNHVWGIKRLLLEWIDFARDSKRAIYNKKLMTVLNDQHMNDLYMFITSEANSKKAVHIAVGSKTRAEAEERFMKEFKVTSMQAETLAKMSMHQFTDEAKKKYKELKVKYEEEIKTYEAILNDDAAVDEIIIEDLKYADKNFGGPRKSAVIKAGKLEEKIPNTMHLVGISMDQHIKKVPMENRSIGIVGKVSQVIVTAVSNRDNLLIFDSTGRISRVGVSSLPDMDEKDIGVDLTRYTKVEGRVISIINESEVTDDNTDDIILVTEKGIGKKVKMSEFGKIKDFKNAIPVDEGDALVAAIPAGDEEFVIYTNFGDGIRLHTTDIKQQRRSAKGLSLISLRSGEKVVGINFIAPGCDKVLYITSNGCMKMTEEKYLPVMNRKDEPLPLVGLDTNETLIGVSFVSVNDTVVVYRKKGKPVTIPLKDVPVVSRAARADKFVKLPNGDKVTGFKVIRAN